MRIDAGVVVKVKEIDSMYRYTWDTRAIAHVTGISHGSVAKILREYRGPKPTRKKPKHDRRTKFFLRDVMWSSDGTEADNGTIILRTIDEKTDYPLGWDIVDSENADEVTAHAESAIMRMGRAPLVWKFDNSGGFKSRKFREFIGKYGIIPYPIRKRTPWTNGRTEREHRDTHQWLAPVIKKLSSKEEIQKDLNEGMLMLNYVKPRAVLGYRTTAQAYFSDKGVTEQDRKELWEEVEKVRGKFVEYNHRKVVRVAMQKLGLYEEYLVTEKRLVSVNRSQRHNVAI